MEVKRRLARSAAKAVQPVMVVVAGRVPWWALLETTGRKSGRRRITPVGNGLRGDTFWIVSEHGRSSDYVANLVAQPRVRVFVGRRWRSGTARLVPDDDARARLRALPRLNSAVVGLIGSDLTTIRIDLDPE